MIPDYPNMRFMHLGVAVDELAPAIDDYRNLFGYQLHSGPFDDPIQRVTVCFLAKESAPDPMIELIAPLGKDSPVHRLLKSGGGAYHICYSVENIDAAVETLFARECMILQTPVPAVAFENRKIAWLFTPSRQLVELVERG